MRWLRVGVGFWMGIVVDLPGLALFCWSQKAGREGYNVFFFGAIALFFLSLANVVIGMPIAILDFLNARDDGDRYRQIMAVVGFFLCSWILWYVGCGWLYQTVVHPPSRWEHRP